MSAFNELMERWLGFKVANRGRSERTAQIYRLALQRLVQFFEERDPLQATDDELLAFAGAWLHHRGVVAASRRPYVSAVRGFYRWAHQYGHIERNPAAILPYPQAGRKLPDVITLANAEKLMWAPDFNTFEGVRDGAMLSLLVGCGLRVSGLVNLNASQVIEHVVDEKRRLVLKVMEKGGKERLVPIPAEADLQLRVYMEHPDLKSIDRALEDGDQVLFVSTRNRSCPPHEYRGHRRRLNRRSVLDMIKRYGRDIGIPELQLHPHAFRHLYGTELVEGDVNMLVVQKMLGHDDPKSTQIYVNTALRKAVREVDRANPLAKMRTPVSDLLKKMRT